jgi:GYF domain 2
MKSYYLHQGDQQTGPYSINQLKKISISPDTPVWTEGMSDWAQAQQVPEIRLALFVLHTAYVAGGPAIEERYQLTASEGMGYMVGKSWKGAVIAACIVLVAFIAFRFQNSQENSSTATVIAAQEKTPLEAKEELRQREIQEPAKYISGKIAYRTTGRETVIEGTLINTATMVNYKNAVISITITTANAKDSKTFSYTLDKELPAGQSVPYEYKIFSRSKVESVKAIIEAAAVNE